MSKKKSGFVSDKKFKTKVKPGREITLPGGLIFKLERIGRLGKAIFTLTYPEKPESNGGKDEEEK